MNSLWRASNPLHSIKTKKQQNSIMKAIQYTEFGGAEVLKIVNVDAPHAGAGQVRIAVRTVGVNPADWKRF